MPNQRDDDRRRRGWGRPDDQRGMRYPDYPDDERGPRRFDDDRGRYRGDDLRSVGSPGIGGGTGHRFDQGRGEREPDEYSRYGRERMGGIGDEDWSPAQSDVERMGRGWGGGVAEGTGGGAGGGRGYDMGQVGRGYGRGYGGRFGGGHAGKGPMNYQRADERIREDVCDMLTDDDHIDASQIEIQVRGGEVTLTGTVASREMKRRAEELAERQRGVKDVHNQLRIARERERERDRDREREAGDGGRTEERPRNGLLPGRQHHPS